MNSTSFKEIYDSEEQELDDLCAFYAEQDFKFDDTSSSSSEAPAEPHRDDDEESKKNKPVRSSKELSTLFICKVDI